MAFGWLASNESGFLLLLVFFFPDFLLFCFTLPSTIFSGNGMGLGGTGRDG